jgi:serine/threonine protein kinase
MESQSPDLKQSAVISLRGFEGQTFIVMEFPDGLTLKHLIGNRPMELERVLDLGIEIADALDAAHARQSSKRLGSKPRRHLWATSI